MVIYADSLVLSNIEAAAFEVGIFSLYAGSKTNTVNIRAAETYHALHILDRESAQPQGTTDATAIRKIPPRWIPPINRYM